MRSIFTLILILFSTSFYSQNIQLDWVTPFGSKTTDDEGKSIDVDVNGNIYTTGYFSGTVDFDPSINGIYNLISNGGSDIFIMKQDPKGNLIWAKQIGNSNQEASSFIKLDNSGNVYITGYFSGTVDFDPNNGIANMSSSDNTILYKDAFLLKLTNSGNYAWAYRTGGYNVDDEGKAIAIDEQDNVHVTGFFSGSMDIDPTNGTTYVSSNGQTDIFSYKLSTTGTFLWGISIGGPNSDLASSIVTMKDGSIWIKGNFKDSVDFDPDQLNKTIRKSTAPSYVSNFFLLNLTSSGKFVQVIDLPYCNSSEVGTIATDKDNNLYIAGQFSGTVDFDPSPSSFTMVSKPNYEDLFLLKLNSKGNFIWAKSIGGISYQSIGKGLGLDKNGYIYLAGNFNGTCDFDPGPNVFKLSSTSGTLSFDAFIVKLKPDGSFDWVNSFGDYYDDGINAIDLDTLGNLCHVGFFRGTVNFGFNGALTTSTSIGGKDIFVQKIRPCSSYPSRTKVIACQKYTWNGITYYTSGQYRAAFSKTSPLCDSIALLDLTINEGIITYGSLDIKACSFYSLNNQTYTQSGKYTQLLRNKKGCDSVLTLNLYLFNNSTQIIQTQNKLNAVTDMPKTLTYQWYAYSSILYPINNETKNTYTPNGDGVYTVVVSNGECSDTSTYYSYQTNCNGSIPNFSWGYNFDKNVSIYAIATDAHGNVYTTGSFSDSVDFDSGEGKYVLYAKTSNNSFIQKTDSKGKHIWTKQLEGDLNYVSNMIIDPSGNLLLQGYFYGITDFDPSPSKQSLTVIESKDLFLLKLNSNGEFIWVRQINDFKQNGDLSLHNKMLKVDGMGNVYFLGFHNGNTDMDPGPSTHLLNAIGDFDIYLIKLSPDGNFIWAKNFGSNQFDEAYSLTVATDGTLYLAGAYLGTSIDLDPGAGSLIAPSGTNNSRYFIVKMNASGDLLWAKQTKGEIPNDLRIAPSGYIYVCGGFNGTIDLNNGAPFMTLTSRGDKDGYILKYDPTGVPIWAHQIGGGTYDAFLDIDISNKEEIYLTSSFSSSVTSSFGLNMSSTGDIDIAFIKLNNLGNLIWARQLKNKKTITQIDVIIDSQDNLISSGKFNEIIDLDLGLGQNLVKADDISQSGYMLKLEQCSNEVVSDLTNVSNSNQNKESLYFLSPNPSNGYIKMESLEIGLESIDIVVRDLNGKEIYAGQYQFSKELSISAPKGIYTLTFWRNEKPYMTKWINN